MKEGYRVSEQYTEEPLVDVFVFEISQQIEQLEKLILTNEEESCYSEDSLNGIFRIMHTIKGSSAMMAYNSISSLAHAMEDLFSYLRENKSENVDCEVLSDLILECIDFMKIEVEKIKNGDQLDGECHSLHERISCFLKCLKNGDSVLDISAYKIIIHFEEDCEMENMRAYSLIHNVSRMANEIHYSPENIESGENSIELIRKNGFIINMKTEAKYEEVNEFFYHSDFIKEFTIDQVSDDKEIESLLSIPETADREVSDICRKEEKTSENKEDHSTSMQQNIISVGVGKLDKLMDLMGELVIAEEMVIQNSDLRNLVLDNFPKAARQLRKITAEMQDMVMSIRMVPLSATFHKMHRLVRDMSKKLSKEINLEIIGEETEVDKKIIEYISDPLMHLVRNAVDHGFECPDEREFEGKNRIGTLTLEAKNTGGDVLIIIKDDGKGLNKSKILEKAKISGLLNKPEEEMLDKEIYNLVFLPGFSTKEDVSEFSGRGVGMDVVTKNIEMVGGTISLVSIENEGTTITLKIPLTLAIIDGMNIKVGNSYYTFPTVLVKEFFKARQQDVIADPDNNEMIMVRGRCYPIIRLYEYYGVENAKTNFDEGIIIMLERDEQIICIFVDELLGQQQVVVKVLPEYIRKLKKIKGLTGCTLLGDGNISLILDITGLISD